MFNAAHIENNSVVNVIYIDIENMEAFVTNGMELIDREPLGLEIGDYREDDTWYRDIDGEKTQLPLPVVNEYKDYYDAMNAEIEGSQSNA